MEFFPSNVVTDGTQGIPVPGRVRPQIRYFIDLLTKERANLNREYNWRIQLSQEVEQLKQELVRQEKQKEMFINRGKETKQELERLQKHSNAETLSTANIATMVHNNIKRRNKKDLQKDYEELQVAHMIYQEKHNNVLQEEKDKTKLLQEELENIRASDDGPCQSHATNQEEFNNELQEEKKKNNALQEELMKLRASYHDVCQSHATNQEKFNTELQEEKNVLQEELMKLTASYHEVCSELMMLRASGGEICQSHTTNQEEFNPEFQGEKNVLQEELMKLRASYDEICSELMAINQEEFITEQQEKKPKKTSLWKRICRFLGLRKRQWWK